MTLWLTASMILNFGVAAGLGAAGQFWWRATRIELPRTSLDARPSLGALRDFARKIEVRGRLNARAGACVAVAAACQAASMATFLLSRQPL